MERHERCEILASLPRDTVVQLAAELLRGREGRATLISPPTVGMVMARAIDGALGELFNLGEVLVTEARVSVDGHAGWGMVLGRDGDHALSIALIDAGLEAFPDDRARVDAQIQAGAARVAAALDEEWAAVAPTRVDFEKF
ncbi:MAG: phosphonate C-P lyase system protein PhnG [Dehalococcoidia bacterium]|nr:phosphonate C-P lyase system protein PhnG [Dehalococcoidia bacterium]